MNETLQVRELNAGYGKIPVLRDVSFRVCEGEIVAIIGPNGAGKSTLLKTISGLISPSSGEITFKGQSIQGLAPHLVAKAGLSHIPEGRRLFANMTVMENLMMGAYASRDNLKMGVLDEVFEMFPVLQERRKQKAKDLSGGQKQMLAVGRGLVSKPILLMLDEPSLGLAPMLVDSIYEKLRMLRERGLTVLLVEQNVNYALELAVRGYVLENGRIVMEGSSEELADSEHIKEHYLGL
jgi:branched-chain amino acid transport system ATP-binding protein